MGAYQKRKKRRKRRKKTAAGLFAPYLAEATFGPDSKIFGVERRPLGSVDLRFDVHFRSLERLMTPSQCSPQPTTSRSSPASPASATHSPVTPNPNLFYFPHPNSSLTKPTLQVVTCHRSYAFSGLQNAIPPGFESGLPPSIRPPSESCS
ncbi:hypothetical protein APHAL10511_005725 [Amanita phalloides]|nr:hypothetical protein APHAL10511_005725 [Amanita phalloides]